MCEFVRVLGEGGGGELLACLKGSYSAIWREADWTSHVQNDGTWDWADSYLNWDEVGEAE